jgi:Domain of unknown function (DUF4105)
MTELANKPSKGRSLTRRVLRGLGIAVLVVLMVGVNLWAAMAICYTHLNGTAPRHVFAAAFVIAFAAAIWLARPWRYKLLVSAASFAVVLTWYFSIHPSNDRDWAPDVANLASATIAGNQLTIHNIRNFDYRSESDFTSIWEDRTYDLDKLRSSDFTLCYWGSKLIAHGIVSFGFDDGHYLAISIETRKQKSQSFSAIEGFFRQYEIIYVVADERDVLRLRTKYRNEDLYMYHTRLNPSEAHAVLLSYVERINALSDHPQFYNALTSNCITDVVPHARAGRPSAQVGWQLVLSGYAARQAYENGRIDTSMPYEQLHERSHINDAAMAADQDPDFSTRIRIGLPVPAPDGGGTEPNITPARSRTY